VLPTFVIHFFWLRQDQRFDAARLYVYYCLILQAGARRVRQSMRRSQALRTSQVKSFRLARFEFRVSSWVELDSKKFREVREAYSSPYFKVNRES
jgi:hypothetical protein